MGGKLSLWMHSQVHGTAPEDEVRVILMTQIRRLSESDPSLRSLVASEDYSRLSLEQLVLVVRAADLAKRLNEAVGEACASKPGAEASDHAFHYLSKLLERVGQRDVAMEVISLLQQAAESMLDLAELDRRTAQFLERRLQELGREGELARLLAPPPVPGPTFAVFHFMSLAPVHLGDSGVLARLSPDRVAAAIMGWVDSEHSAKHPRPNRWKAVGAFLKGLGLRAPGNPESLKRAYARWLSERHPPGRMAEIREATREIIRKQAESRAEELIRRGSGTH